MWQLINDCKEAGNHLWKNPGNHERVEIVSYGLNFIGKFNTWLWYCFFKSVPARITHLNLWKDNNVISQSPSDIAYMRTSFNFLTNAQSGIKTTKKIKWLLLYSKSPFASVDNIIGAEIVKEDPKNENLLWPYLKFDSIGIKDL